MKPAIDSGSRQERPPKGPQPRIRSVQPGLYCLKNFCGGGFRFDAKVNVTEHTVDILHLQGTVEA